MKIAADIFGAAVMLVTAAEAGWRLSGWPKRDPGWFDALRLVVVGLLGTLVLAQGGII